MKTLKLTFRLLFLISILLWSCQSEAQRPNLKDASAEDIAEMQTGYQSKQLDLTDEQTQELQSINLKYAKELVMFREKDPAERSFEDLKVLNQKQNQEVKAILSDEQFKRYLKLKQKTRERLRERRQKRMKKGQNNQQKELKNRN
ncbi:MAG: hypothetical protein GVY05_07000 [Bacteroidetes bacterium]|jgi:hypothetical protein|nr:hypothetical protein [Bacteroidota bacterium]